MYFSLLPLPASLSCGGRRVGGREGGSEGRGLRGWQPHGREGKTSKGGVELMWCWYKLDREIDTGCRSLISPACTVNNSHLSSLEGLVNSTIRINVWRIINRHSPKKANFFEILVVGR